MRRKFKTIQEERAFWDSHNVTDYLSELKTAGIVFQRPPLRRNFQIRLDEETVRKLKELANRKGTDVSTILRGWIQEHLKKKSKNA